MNPFSHASRSFIRVVSDCAKSLLPLFLGIGFAGPSHGQTPEECFTWAGGEWLLGTGGALVAPVGPDFIFSSAAYAANLILKECPTHLAPPPDVFRHPTPADSCGYTFSQPVISGVYESNVDEQSMLWAGVNALDGIDLSDFPHETIEGAGERGSNLPFNLPPAFDSLLGSGSPLTYPYVRPGNPLLNGLGFPAGYPEWGDLGIAPVAHFDTSVELRLIVPSRATRDDETIRFPLGEHFVRWEADTLRSPPQLRNRSDGVPADGFTLPRCQLWPQRPLHGVRDAEHVDVAKHPELVAGKGLALMEGLVVQPEHAVPYAPLMLVDEAVLGDMVV